MKKRAFIMMSFICLLVFPFSIKAFCYSKDKIKFQKLAENIDYTYAFDENTKLYWCPIRSYWSPIACNCKN